MKNQPEMYLFEYNEKDGNFHQNFGDHAENTNGYKTICETRVAFWYPFGKMLKRRYNFNSVNRPSFEDVQKEWDDYLLLLEDIHNYKED